MIDSHKERRGGSFECFGPPVRLQVGDVSICGFCFNVALIEAMVAAGKQEREKEIAAGTLRCERPQDFDRLPVNAQLLDLWLFDLKDAYFEAGDRIAALKGGAATLARAMKTVGDHWGYNR